MLTGVEILVYSATLSGAQGLAAGLTERGHRVDLVCDQEAAEQSFLARGGHALLLLSPDLPGRCAQEAVLRLRSVDPQLPVLVFGEALLRDSKLGRIHRIHSFHPESRAGLGAVQKFCCSLRA